MDFIKNSIWTFISKLVFLVICVGITIIINRTLGPEGRGEYVLITLIPSFLIMISSLGIETANIYFIGKKRFNIEDVVSNSLFLGLLIGFIVVIVIIIVISIIPTTFYQTLKIKDVNYLKISILIIPLALIFSYFSSIFLGVNKIIRYNILILLQHTLLFLLLFIFLYIFSSNTKGAILAWVIQWIITLVITLFFIKKICILNIRYHPEITKKSLSFGIKGYFSTIITFLNSRVDIFLVGYFTNTMMVGYYSTAVPLVESLALLSNSISIVLFPKIASITEEKADVLTPKVCRNLLFITTIGALFLGLIGKQLIIGIYGEEFLPALKPLLILLPGIVALSISKVLNSDIIGRGKPIISIYTSLSALGINIILNLLLIPKWGIIGAAFASTIAYGVASIVSIIFFLRHSHTSKIGDILFIKQSDLAVYKNLLIPKVNLRILN